MNQGRISKGSEYIDALRGIAILGVVMVHASQQVRPRANWLLWFMTEGARGVQLFFVVSALTLCMSWAGRFHREQFPVRNFYTRRFFRIAPLFYCAILLYLCVNGFGASYWAPEGIHWWFVFATAFFLHGWHPETINSVVPGGWSIAAEMAFYVAFPVAISYLSKISRLLAAFVVSLALYWAFISIVPHAFDLPVRDRYLLESFPYLSLWGQLPIFLMGLLVYPLRSRIRMQGLNLAFFLLILCVCAYFLRNPFNAHVHHLFGGGLFFALTLLLSFFPVKPLVNGVTIWFGKLSYSIYLVHFAVISALGSMGVTRLFPNTNTGSLMYMVLIAVSAGVLAMVSKKLIEDPFIAYGGRLIARRESVN